MKELFEQQAGQLGESHFLALSWAAQAEDRRIKYNITNYFDDLKYARITRTKQNAVTALDALRALRFVDIREEGNRKNIYITKYGAKALEGLVLEHKYALKASAFLEGQ